MDGKEDLGASSPERPALHMPDPLSMTTAWFFYSDIPSTKLVISLAIK
jgi:hypothetical protein